MAELNLAVMPKSRGLSIAEVLLATTLLAGMAVSLFGVWAIHARATAQSREQLTAGCWADQLMDEALSQGYTVTNQTTPNPPFRMAHIVEGQRIYSDYYYRTYVDENPTPTNPGLKDVTVEVWWQHGDQWRNIKLVTRLGWQG